MRLLLFCLASFGIASAHAQNQCIDLFSVSTTPSLTGSFGRLAESQQLLNQLDQRIVERGGLIVDEGGLCASTCAVNVIHAIHDFLGVANDHDYVSRMHFIMEDAFSTFGVNGRLGIQLEQLASAIDAQFRLEYRFQVHSEHVSGGFVSASTFSPKPNQLIIASYHMVEGAHAVVILKVDPVTKIVEYNDPNTPNEITKTTYEMIDVNGRQRMKIHIMEPWKESGMILEIIKVNAIKY